MNAPIQEIKNRRAGFEYHLLVIAMALALLLSGGGSLSADARIARRQL